MRREGESTRGRRLRALAGAVVVVAVLTPAAAGAGVTCDVYFSLNPGWRGATVQVTGDGFAPNDSIALYVNLMHAVSNSTNSEGEFAMTWNIPNDFPVGSHDFLAFDGFGWCDVDGTYTVNAGPPTTTTSTTTSTTTTSTTTTTLAPTTTEAPTTTVAPTTTTSVPEVTTTTAADSGGGGVDSIVWILLVVIAVLVGIVGYQFGVRRRGDRP